jgi:hypothetical protein
MSSTRNVEYVEFKFKRLFSFHLKSSFQIKNHFSPKQAWHRKKMLTKLTIMIIAAIAILAGICTAQSPSQIPHILNVTASNLPRPCNSILLPCASGKSCLSPTVTVDGGAFFSPPVCACPNGNYRKRFFIILTYHFSEINSSILILKLFQPVPLRTLQNSITHVTTAQATVAASAPKLVTRSRFPWPM